MANLILGRYIPGDSFVHRLDPRSKLLSMLIFIIVVFWANNVLTNLLMFVFTMILVFLSRVKISFFLKGSSFYTEWPCFISFMDYQNN